MCVCDHHSVVSNSLRPHGLQPTRFLCPWNSPGKNPGLGCHSLLQGIFPTQGSNLGLPHCRQIFFYHLSHQGNTNNVEFSIKYRDEDSLSYLTSNWKPRRDFSKMLTIKELSFFFFFLLEQCIERQIQQPGNWDLKKV